MRYFISIILALSILNVKAQKKISFDLLFDAGTVFSQSKPVVKYSPGYISYDPNTGVSTYIPGTSKAINKYKNIITPKISLGCNANYSLRENFKAYGGLCFSYLNAKRKNIVALAIPFSPSQNFEYITEEIFNFYNVDIPLGVTYTKEKWSFNLCILSSIILSSNFASIIKTSNPEIQPLPPATLNPLDPQPTSDNKTKKFVSLSISPLYQLSNKLKIGIAYNHALTNSYSTNWYSADFYQSMKTSSLGLKFLYKLN
jgi:hypothetical protein